MKLTKFCAFSTALLAASLAFADAANVCITFHTKGPDCYADGTPAVEKEWYALVWLAPGATFGGVTTQLEAVSADNKVLLAAPLATGGENSCCPLVMWQIDSAKAEEEGSYTVVMLDTRGSDGKAAASTDAGKPKVVYASASTEASVAATKKGSSAAVATSSETTGATVTKSTGSVGAEKPQITAFEIVGGNAVIAVSGMVPGLTYKVMSGSELGNLKTSKFEVPKSSGQVIVPADEAKFFSIKGE